MEVGTCNSFSQVSSTAVQVWSHSADQYDDAWTTVRCAEPMQHNKTDKPVQTLTTKLTLRSKMGVDLYSASFNSPE